MAFYSTLVICFLAAFAGMGMVSVYRNYKVGRESSDPLASWRHALATAALYAPTYGPARYISILEDPKSHLLAGIVFALLFLAVLLHSLLAVCGILQKITSLALGMGIGLLATRLLVIMLGLGTA